MRRAAMWMILLCGCGDGTSMAPGADAATGSTRAVIRGEVRYDGSQDGSLLVGVFEWDEAHPSQPMGPPADFVPVTEPTFPMEWEIAGLRPGAYFAGAVLDVGRDNPTIPGEEDLERYSERIDVEAGDVVVVDLELRDE